MTSESDLEATVRDVRVGYIAWCRGEITRAQAATDFDRFIARVKAEGAVEVLRSEEGAERAARVAYLRRFPPSPSSATNAERRAARSEGGVGSRPGSPASVQSDGAGEGEGAQAAGAEGERRERRRCQIPPTRNMYFEFSSKAGNVKKRGGKEKREKTTGGGER